MHFRSTLRRAPSVLNTSSALPKQRVVSCENSVKRGGVAACAARSLCMLEHR